MELTHELAGIAVAVATTVAQRNADSLARGEEPHETVSSWIRRHALEPMAARDAVGE